MAQQSTAADLMAITNMMNALSLPTPPHPTRLVNSNGKRRAEDDALLLTTSSPTKETTLQHPQETKTILPLPAKATTIDFEKLPTELVLIIMESADLKMLVNLTLASDAARQAFFEHPAAFQVPLESSFRTRIRKTNHAAIGARRHTVNRRRRCGYLPDLRLRTVGGGSGRS